MSSVIRLEERQTPIGPVRGWRRWMGREADGDGGLLISRPSAPPAAGDGRDAASWRRAAFLRHPGLARIIEADVDAEGPLVIEEVGEARPLSDGRCRVPRAEALAAGLLRLLEALAYLHRQGLAHGAISRETVFSDGRHLLLTGAAPGSEAAVSPSSDVRDWAELTREMLAGADGGPAAGLLREAADQALAALDGGRSLDGGRVIRAIHRAERQLEEAAAPGDDEEAAEAERTWQMKALLAVTNFMGSVVVGLLTTILTLAVIGGAIALGVIWFVGQLPQEVQVPMVVGLESDEARARLEDEGLKAGRVRSVYREDVEPGHVADSVPPAGMVVREGREVTLVVSMGAARVNVPRLVGLRLDEAEKVLEKQGLRLVDGGKVRSNSPEGEIVEQEPPPGQKIAQGERVVAKTSGGPEFGILEVAGDDEDDSPRRVVFRRVEIVVPRGDALQRVIVREGYGGDLETTYDRLHRPGDRIKLDTYGRPGKQIRVVIEGEEVFKTVL